jgi:hypothetical protein
MFSNSARLRERLSLFSLRTVFFLLVFSLTAGSAFAQTPLSNSSDKQSDEQHAPGSIEEEMKAKRAIKYAEEEHKENIDRAKEVCEIAGKLEETLKSKDGFVRDDVKKLERLEKLAKQLRSKAGGSDSDEELDKPPTDLKSALTRVIEVSESLSDAVQKTPRQVVSATVIDEANVLLQLIKIVRQLSP